MKNKSLILKVAIAVLLVTGFKINNVLAMEDVPEDVQENVINENQNRLSFEMINNGDFFGGIFNYYDLHIDNKQTNSDYQLKIFWLDQFLNILEIGRKYPNFLEMIRDLKLVNEYYFCTGIQEHYKSKGRGKIPEDLLKIVKMIYSKKMGNMFDDVYENPKLVYFKNVLKEDMNFINNELKKYSDSLIRMNNYMKIDCPNSKDFDMNYVATVCFNKKREILENLIKMKRQQVKKIEMAKYEYERLQNDINKNLSNYRTFEDFKKCLIELSELKRKMYDELKKSVMDGFKNIEKENAETIKELFDINHKRNAEEVTKYNKGNKEIGSLYDFISDCKKEMFGHEVEYLNTRIENEDIFIKICNIIADQQKDSNEANVQNKCTLM